jgi:hypothetical protein
MNSLKSILMNSSNYYIKLVVLFIFWKIIKRHPKFKDYKKETVFSMYRSLMCLFFMLYSLENLICNFTDLLNCPTKERDCYQNITEWFIVYLIMDIVKMILEKNTRVDLYLHHIWCLISVVLGKYYNNAGAIFNLVLINEAISVVSGADSMAMEDNNMKESYYYKLYRRNIIRYLRLPIWILGLLIVLRHTDKINSSVWWNSVLSSFVMIGLDHYWEKKCNKVVDKYNDKPKI